MIHERDYSISLEKQIENIRKTIDVNRKEDYPIDIMDGINQIYLERWDGYWERYEYDADGKIKSYVDSTDPEHPTVIGAARKRNVTLDNIHLLKLPIIHLSSEEKMEAVRTILQKENKEGVIIRDGGLRRGITINPAIMGVGSHVGYLPRVIYNHEYPDGFNLKYKQPIKVETKVFLVELNDILGENKIDYTSCDDITFMTEANRQSKGGIRIFTLAQFQEKCNSGKTSIVSAIIRFIEVSKVISNDLSGSM